MNKYNIPTIVRSKFESNDDCEQCRGEGWIWVWDDWQYPCTTCFPWARGDEVLFDTIKKAETNKMEADSQERSGTYEEQFYFRPWYHCLLPVPFRFDSIPVPQETYVHPSPTIRLLHKAFDWIEEWMKRESEIEEKKRCFIEKLLAHQTWGWPPSV